MSQQIEYHLISEDTNYSFNTELNRKVKEGWQPIGNVVVAMAKSQYAESKEYVMLLQRIKNK